MRGAGTASPAGAGPDRGRRGAPLQSRLRKTPVLQAFFSSEGSVALQFLVIFLIILALFLIAALLFVRLSGRGLTVTARPGQRGRQPRLGIVDIYELDRQRQLILLRRDNVEHLLLVGGPNDVVVERHIQRGAGTRYASEGGRSEGEIGGSDAALDPPRTDPFLDSPRPPTFTMPEVVPPPVPGAPHHAERAPPLDTGLFEPEEPAPDAQPRSPSPVSRLMRRTLPPLVTPRVEPASERTARPEEAPATAAPASAEPPVIPSRGPRSVDPAVLSDMARQLQVALKRPSSAVTPPPATPAPVQPTSPEPVEPAAPVQDRPRPDPMAVAMALSQGPAPDAATAPTPPPAPPQSPSAGTAPDAIGGSERDSRPTPTPAPPAKPAAPPPAETSAASRPEPARTDRAAPDASDTAPQGQNPFSVEEIEAEFARLLGRPLDSKN